MSKNIFIALAILAVVATALPRYLEEDEYSFAFEKFVNQHKKQYHSVSETLRRFKIFKDNLDKVVHHGRHGSKSYKLAMNEFGDLTSEEFKEQMLAFRPSMRGNAPIAALSTADVPTSVNWVSKGVVTPVKNQGQCGSCWAFSTTGSIESAHAIKTGQLISLSEQELVDCAGSTGNQGCNGGEMQAAMKWVEENGGLCSESAYPYQGVDGTCQKSSCTSQVSIQGYKNVQVNNEDALQAAAAQQPISVAVDAGGSDWQLYSGGVMDDPNCGTQLDHGVLVAGYGSENGQDYWLVKNSWGASWGENGYIKIGRGTGSGQPGICGIAMDPCYPQA